MSLDQFKYELIRKGETLYRSGLFQFVEREYSDNLKELLRSVLSLEWQFISSNQKDVLNGVFYKELEIIRKNEIGKDKLFLREIRVESGNEDSIIPGIYLQGTPSMIKEVEELLNIQLQLKPGKEETSFLIAQYIDNDGKSGKLKCTPLREEMLTATHKNVAKEPFHEYTLFVRERNDDDSIAITHLAQFPTPKRAIDNLLLIDFSQMDPDLNRKHGKSLFMERAIVVGPQKYSTIAEICFTRLNYREDPQVVCLHFPEGPYKVRKHIENDLFKLMDNRNMQQIGQYKADQDTILPTAPFKLIQDRIRQRIGKGLKSKHAGIWRTILPSKEPRRSI